MAKHLQRATDGHLMKEDGGHLANGCEPCSCEGHGPITATLTVTGGCDVGGGCADHCDNDVFTLAWNGDLGGGGLGGWAGFGDGNWWYMEVWCHENVWYAYLAGGCWNGPGFTQWQTSYAVDADDGTVFEPEGCETDNGNGYPTHSGIVFGNPTNDQCWDDCAPTVALS